MLVIHKPLDNTSGASITSKQVCQGTPLAYSVTESAASFLIQINEQDDEKTPTAVVEPNEDADTVPQLFCSLGT
ncbi:MAG: hypothetical protein PHV61_10360 [Limnochordia bacterium]|jgi:hypothetical protein|nr:hypothetical protein [Limnochordia bacterium]MDD2630544.1 hypothetical protein [Limnochordia bacterium]